ncbi:hypothetical protein Salat_1185200 [Sesamum alatum]|uniref:Uncharacterized protein n=1 Tax=Sesamum alatum TaxID=300844 RepID=A0AAE2CNM4_9LAMI|nr:hypothetical protein Salat_1185200 [Sesamum alatum]
MKEGQKKHFNVRDEMYTKGEEVSGRNGKAPKRAKGRKSPDRPCSTPCRKREGSLKARKMSNLIEGKKKLPDCNVVGVRPYYTLEQFPSHESAMERGRTTSAETIK